VSRLFGALVGPLVDLRARRALEETFLDWSHEVQLARSPLARLLCRARALLAFARTIVSIVANEIGESLTNSIWLRIGLWLIGTLPLHLFVNRWILFSDVTQSSAGLQLILALLLLPNWLLLFAPFAFFLGAVQQPQRGTPRTPFLGVVFASFVLALCLAGWIMPLANQQFRQSVLEATGGMRHLVPGSAELTLPQLTAAAAQWLEPRVLRELNIRLSLVLTGPMLVILAAQLQRLSGRYRWLTAVACICGCGFFIEELAKSHDLETRLIFWCLPAMALALSVLLGLAGRTSGSRASA
jgi:hypothetical protein